MSAARVVGLASGTGSGRTHVGHMYNVLYNVPIYNADEKFKNELVKYPTIKRKIVDTFGTNSYINDKYNDRKFRELLFTDKKALKKMNDIVVPEMLIDIFDWRDIQTFRGYRGPYVLVDCAIIFETDMHLSFFKNILVTSPINMRVDRLLKKRKMSLGQINDIIKNQDSDGIKRFMMDYEIVNDGKPISGKIEFVHNNILTVCDRTDLIFKY